VRMKRKRPGRTFSTTGAAAVAAMTPTALAVAFS
jgi:hypothetical protein